MLQNRSIPRSAVIPTLAYSDVTEAANWLCDVFGFSIRLQIANHRTQLNVGDGAVVVTERREGNDADYQHSVMVRIEDVHKHFEHARAAGAKVLQPPADHPYGERQYSVQDLGGHIWTFSQSIADVDPVEWGGTPGKM